MKQQSLIVFQKVLLALVVHLLVYLPDLGAMLGLKFKTFFGTIFLNIHKTTTDNIDRLHTYIYSTYVS